MKSKWGSYARYPTYFYELGAVIRPDVRNCVAFVFTSVLVEVKSRASGGIDGSDDTVFEEVHLYVFRYEFCDGAIDFFLVGVASGEADGEVPLCFWGVLADAGA